MRSTTSLSALLAITTFLVVPTAATTTCQAGKYSLGALCEPCAPGSFSDKSGATSCTLCPAGTYQPNFGQTSCQSAQVGWYAPGPGAIVQLICTSGFYSSQSGSSSCTICPAGHHCNGQGSTTPVQCQPGRYSPTVGLGQDCFECPMGTFNSQYGQTGCCACCSGWYNNQVGQTHCFNCPNVGAFRQGWSRPGAILVTDCLAVGGALPQCSQSSSGTCPGSATASQAPQVQKRNLLSCKPGWKSCPIPGRLGRGNECVDVQNDLWSCGGCAGSDSTGVDCSAIPHADDVRCKAGSCQIRKCNPGYTPSLDGKLCVKSHSRRFSL